MQKMCKKFKIQKRLFKKRYLCKRCLYLIFVTVNSVNFLKLINKSIHFAHVAKIENFRKFLQLSKLTK